MCITTTARREIKGFYTTCIFLMRCFRVNLKALYLPISVKKHLKWTRVYYFVNYVNVKLMVKNFFNIIQHLKTDTYSSNKMPYRNKIEMQ